MSKTSHICLLTSGRIFEVAYGGEEKFTISLGNWLIKQGHEVTLMGAGFASAKAKRLFEEYRVKDEEGHIRKPPNTLGNIRVLYPPYFIYLLSRLVMSLLWILKILSIHTKTRITLIHAQDTGYSGLAAVLSGRLLKIPVIISSHGIRHKSLDSIIQGRFRKALLNFEYKLDTFTIKNANGIIVVNSSIRNYYSRITSSKKIDVIPIPIKLRNFEFSEELRGSVRKELEMEKNSIVIGFVGRFSEEKNLHALLDSFATVLRGNPTVKLVLVGTGPLESEFKDWVYKNGIEQNVTFCGVRYDIGRILCGFDIFVLPSYVEGLSTALLEAMTSGRAIICSDIPANHELAVHDKEALFISPRRTEEITKAIQELSNDPQLRLRLGNNAKIRASQYDEDKVFPKILQNYEKLMILFNIK